MSRLQVGGSSSSAFAPSIFPQCRRVPRVPLTFVSPAPGNNIFAISPTDGCNNFMTCPRSLLRVNSSTRTRTRRRIASSTRLLNDMADSGGPSPSGGKKKSKSDNNRSNGSNSGRANNYDDDASGDPDADPIEQLDFDTDLAMDENFEFDESQLLEYDLLEEEDGILDELDIAEEMGILDDDEFLMQIDDDFIIAAKRVGEDPMEGTTSSRNGLVELEASELGDAFEQDGREYRSIDDDMLLEILGLPDEAEDSDEQLQQLKLTEIDAQKAADYLEDLFEEQERAGAVMKGGTTRSAATAAASAALSAPEVEETYLSTAEAGTAARESGFLFQPLALEKALEVGVLPTEAGVGTGALPGDFDWDPLSLSTKDHFKRTQRFLVSLLPGGPSLKGDEKSSDGGYDGGALPKEMRTLDELEVRPQSLIIRDYREAEIRHGRLAMLAVIFWPLQELVDRALIPESFGRTTFVYGGPTLPFFPLLMTFVMLNLGYLDIFASEIKKDESGEAFLPGECFWDPLKMLDGAPDAMKRNFQQRELFNGRIAMLAVAAFFFEEAVTHKPLILGKISQYLFNPLYEFPEVQAWFDSLFGGGGMGPVIDEPDGQVSFVDALREALEEEADKAVEEQLLGSGVPVKDPALEAYSMKYNR